MDKLFIILSLIINSLGQCQTIPSKIQSGSIDDNFIGGRTEFYNVFKSKLQYPEELKDEKITGSVYFEIEIDTSGVIVDFNIIKGVTPLMDQEVEKKIYLTNGKWGAVIRNGKKVNYRIVEKVYFELR